MAQSFHDLRDEQNVTTGSGESRSIGQLFSEMAAELGTLMRKEVELAKVEAKEELSTAAKAGGKLGAGGFAGYMALLFVSLALALLLDLVMPAALAFFLVGVLYAIVAAVLLAQGRKQMKQVKAPQQTVETLKEDVQWAKAQTS